MSAMQNQENSCPYCYGKNHTSRPMLVFSCISSISTVVAADFLETIISPFSIPCNLFFIRSWFACSFLSLQYFNQNEPALIKLVVGYYTKSDCKSRMCCWRSLTFRFAIVILVTGRTAGQSAAGQKCTAQSMPGDSKREEERKRGRRARKEGRRGGGYLFLLFCFIQRSPPSSMAKLVFLALSENLLPLLRLEFIEVAFVPSS